MNCIVRNTNLISKSRGQYDDFTVRDVCVVTNPNRAKVVLELLVELQEFNKGFAERVKNEFETQYASAHPTPASPERPIPNSRFRDLQNLLSPDAARMGVTEGQREKFKAEFKTEQKAHEKNLEAYSLRIQQHYKQTTKAYKLHKEAQAAWIEANYNPPPNLFIYQHLLEILDDYDWEFSIGEVPIIG